MADTEIILKEIQELKNLALLSTKTALTLADAAILTGLSNSHIYKLCCYRKIPYYKSSGGKHSYFDRNELNAWMLNRRIKTDEELETEAATHVVNSKKRK